MAQATELGKVWQKAAGSKWAGGVGCSVAVDCLA